MGNFLPLTNKVLFDSELFESSMKSVFHYELNRYVNGRLEYNQFEVIWDELIKPRFFADYDDGGTFLRSIEDFLNNSFSNGDLEINND